MTRDGCDDCAPLMRLEFRLPAQVHEARLALAAGALAGALFDLDQELARYLRGKGMPYQWHVEGAPHGPDEFLKAHLDAFEHARGLIRELLDEARIAREDVLG